MDAAPPSRHHAEMGNSAGNCASSSNSQPQATWRITFKDGQPFAFAGPWERWEKAPDGVPVESCTIVTTAANQLLRPLHDRMPVILAPEIYGAWLGEGSASPPELLALLRPYPPDAMRAYPVSTVVNGPKNDGPERVELAA